MAKPLAAEPVVEDVGQEQRAALRDRPSLRAGVKVAQGLVDVDDGLREHVPVFVLQTDFDRALAAVAGRAGRLVIASR